MLSRLLRAKHSIFYLGITVSIASADICIGAQKIPAEYKAQINQQVALAATEPAKVTAKLLTPEIRVGGSVQVQIALINRDNQPVTPREDWKCDVSIRFPSGKSVDQVAWIKKDSRSGQFEFPADEPGLVSVFVRPAAKEIRGDKLEVIVQPSKKPLGKKNSSLFEPILVLPTAGIEVYPNYSRELPAGLKLVAFGSMPENQKDSWQNQHKHSVTTKNGPVLHISAGDVGGTYFATGKDAATISAIFESPDLSPAPGDIHVWFHWDNGGLDTQPLLIKKGTFSGVTHLTCLRPGDVRVNFVSSTPTYQVEGDTDITAHFVPPLVVLLGPEKLSIVDNTPVMIVFLDGQNNPVAPGKNWSVTLHSKESKLHFGPETFEVPGNSPMGSSSTASGVMGK